MVIPRRHIPVLGVMLVLALLLAPHRPAAAAELLMSYGVELDSNYVFRGDDMYVRQSSKDGKKHPVFRTSPVLRPRLLLFSSQIRLDAMGIFAVTDRKDDLTNSKGPFFGLDREDELDLSLSYFYSNRLGRFTGGIIYYSPLDQGRLGPDNEAPPQTITPVPTEFVLRWAPTFWKAINPEFSHYATSTPGLWYSSVAFGSGARTLGYRVNAGFVRTGPKDLTGQISYKPGTLSFTFNAAYRPQPKTLAWHGAPNGYDSDGMYVPDPSTSSTTAKYPTVIAWIGIEWLRSVQ